MQQERRLGAIAIVGFATEFPSGEHSTSNLSHEEFFRMLLQKKETYQKIPEERFDIEHWRGYGPGQIKVDTGSFLKDISEFDHVEFGVTAKDARAMAVSTRKLLELSFLSLLDSGIDYRGQDVGCFMSAVDFDILSIAYPDVNDARGSFAGVPCMVANKVSYHLDLLGPSIPLNTACSSSLTALHLAVQSVRNGDCKAAVVGGCQLNHRLIDWIQYSQGSVLSPDGKCKPFDASADGFSRGEGAAVIVIKPLDDALRDGDRVYASILGTGINSSGFGAPVSAPVAVAQKDAMHRAYRGTGRHPHEVDFVEMHATGTAAGDPIEANWVGASFQRGSEIPVGSVKGNIGHLEITAFLASLSKVCSMFETGLIPPTVNVRTLNPKIKWDEYRLRVVSEVAPLTARHPSGRALVSIASSGIGGSNGHAVVEGPPQPCPELEAPTQKNTPVLLSVGSLSLRSISALCDRIAAKAPQLCFKELASLAAVSGRRARQMTWRSVAVYSPDDQSSPTFSAPALSPRTRGPLVYVFAGQGPQYLEMGRDLFQSYQAFRESILALDEVYFAEVGESFVKSTGLFTSVGNNSSLPSTWPVSVTLPAMAMIQLALVDLLRSINVFPDIVIGHSAGETAMLYANGAASRDFAMSLAIARGKAMKSVEEAGGAMAALSCNPSVAISLIIDVSGGALNDLEISCYNSSDAVTIAGREDLVDRAVLAAEKRGIFARKLRTRVAVHSRLMDVCQAQYRELVEGVFERHGKTLKPSITTYSTLTGQLWNGPFTADYYWNSARHPVLFSDAISELSKSHPNATFLEISPHPVLSPYVRAMGVNNSSIICPMERPKTPRKHHEISVFLTMVGQLLVRGYNSIDFVSLNGFRAVPRLPSDILNYPFTKKRVPFLPEQLTLDQWQGKESATNRPKIYKINGQTHPELTQHVIKGEPIMPAAAFIEMGLSQGARQLRDVHFRSMMPLMSNDPQLVRLEFDEQHWSIASVGESGKKAKVHAEGLFANQARGEKPETINIQAIIDKCDPVDIKGFYDQLRYFADYGPIFQRLISCYKGEEEAIARIKGSSQDLSDSMSKYVIHPAILDACLHLGVHRMFTGNTNDQEYYLPSGVDSVVLHDSYISNGMPEDIYVHTRFKAWSPDRLSFDFTIADEKGTPLCELCGMSVTKHRSTKKVSLERCYDIKNEKLSVEAIPLNLSHAPLPDSATTIVHYVRGQEMQIKAKLLSLNRYENLDIWFLADNDLDGAAARGLTRTLRREIPTWRIRLILFPAHFAAEFRVSTLNLIHERAPSEDEIELDDAGNMLAPRIVESPVPRRLISEVDSGAYFDSGKVYLLLGGIGSLGVQIALWMCEHGARHIVLTSRSGKQSKALREMSTRRILSYIRELPGTSLLIEECDAASTESLRLLLNAIDRPIGGCMLLAGLVSDRSFFSQTAESFAVPFAPKTDAFLAVRDAIDISKLDFLVAFSTVSTFGNSGQTNYAAANTLLDEMTRAYPNAFSITVPLVLDSAITEKTRNISHLKRWGISSEDLCEYLGDALLKLRDGSFWLYIPNLDWSVVRKDMGRSSLYDHLVPDDIEEVAESDTQDRPALLRSIVMKYVDVDPEDFFPAAPLSSYGLDSLTAAQLSYDLQPFLRITQLQLLADISFDDILSRADEHTEQSTLVTETSQSEKFSWLELNKTGETVVKLQDGEGVPLILVHGASGNIVAFKPMQDLFTTPLWAIQLTSEAPTQSVPELAKFYYDEIKKARPDGPYRIGGYSGSSMITYELAHIMESNGEEIKQLVMIDHFPTLFYSSLFQIDEETVSQGMPSRKLVAQVVSSICDLYRRDKNPARRKIADDLSAALNGDDVTPYIRSYYTTSEDIIAMTAKFVLDLAGGDVDSIPEAIRTWVRQIAAPVSLYLASEGVLKDIVDDGGEWESLGASHCLDSVQVMTIEGSHFEMMENTELITNLEKGWSF